MTDTDATGRPTRCLLLTGGDPGLDGLPCTNCRAPIQVGHHFVAAVSDGVTAKTHSPTGEFLCTRCAHEADPALAEAAQALDLLRALAHGMEGQQAATFARALAEIAELCTVREPVLSEVPAR